MGTQANSIAESKRAITFHEEMAHTRAQMSGTIEQLHGRLNPLVLKEQAMDQWQEAKATVKSDLKAEFESIKEEVKSQLGSAATALKSEVIAELDEAKVKIKQEITEAKLAVREATLGKVETMVHDVQTAVRTTSRSVTEIVKANPIPALMAGIGLAWLWASSRRASSSTNGSRSSARNGTQGTYRVGGTDLGSADSDTPGLEDRVNEAWIGAGDKLSEAANAVESTASEVVQKASEIIDHAKSKALAATHSARDKVDHLAHSTSEAAKHISHDVKEQAVLLEERAERLYQDNPLGVGAAVIAVGTVLGLAIPITRREKELMGPTRDQWFGEAKQYAHGALDTVHDVANHLADDTAHRLANQVNAGMSPANSVSAETFR